MQKAARFSLAESRARLLAGRRIRASFTSSSHYVELDLQCAPLLSHSGKHISGPEIESYLP